MCMDEYRLVLLQGEQEVDEWPLPTNRASILGRYDRTRGAPDVDLAPDRTVSRRHAQVWFEDGLWWIEDLESLQGTFVGPRRLRGGPAVPLAPGVDLRLGETRLALFAPSWHRFRHRGLLVEIGLEPAIGYLTLRSGQSGISRLVVRSRAVSPSGELSLDLTLGRVAKASLRIAGLEAGEDRAIAPPALQLDMGAVEELTERGWMPLTLSLGGEIVETRGLGCWVLAYNEWSHAPEHWTALAAFVLPNHPSVIQFAADACAGLPQGTDPESLLERLYDHLATIWRIGYRHEPPHYASGGQKIRLPHDVLANSAARTGQGTCIDLAVLIAAALEALGAQPLLAVVDAGAVRHALVGCWREVRPRIEPLVRDPERLLAGAAWIDPNGCTDDPAERKTFAEARNWAHRRLREPGLSFALDVVAARADGISPLPFAGEPRWGEAAAKVIGDAEEVANGARTQVATVPLLVGLLRSREASVRGVFSAVLGDPDTAAERLVAALSSSNQSLAPSQHYGDVLAAAKARAKAAGSPLVHAAHLLAALLDVQSQALDDSLRWLGTDRAVLRGRLREIGPEALGLRGDPSAFAVGPK